MRGAWKTTLAAACLLAGTWSATPCVRAQDYGSAGQGPAGASQQASSGSTEPRPVIAFRAGAGITWDSNPFLLSDSVNPRVQLGTSNKSDTVTSAFAGISIDKQYSLQRFYLDATETAYRHGNFSYLDFDAFQYRAGWDWRVGTQLSGALSADRSKALINYGDFRNTSVLNTVTTEHRLASLDGWVSGGWHVLLAGTQDVSKNSVPFVQVASYRLTGGDGGVRYLAQSGSSIEFHAASGRGEYLDQPLDPVRLIDDGFRRSESYAVANLPFSAKSTLRARLGWVDYRNDHFAQRDFSGTVRTLSYLWRPTEKLSFALSAARDRMPYVADTSSYVVNDTLSLAPSWRLSPKTALTLTLSQTASDYGGPVVASAAPLRHDDLSSAELALNWTPLRSVTVNAGLRHQRRSSNTPGFDYDDSGASVNASVLF
jgi:exopolysaccharide biosynthesis operon protein EpsL